MSVCRAAAADETRLLGNQFNVIPVANPPRRRQRQHGFVYCGGSPSFFAPILTPEPRLRGQNISSRGHNTCQSRLKNLLDALRISRCQSIFGAKNPLSPIGGIVVRFNLFDFGCKSGA
jgi:hypothetical protein